MIKTVRDNAGLRENVCDIFRFLQAVHSESVAQVVDVADYKDTLVCWQNDLPDNECIRFLDACKDPASLWELDKVVLPQPPEVPGALEGWLASSPDDSEAKPAYFDNRNLLSQEEQRVLSQLRDALDQCQAAQEVLANNEESMRTEEEVEAWCDKSDRLESEKEELLNAIRPLVEREDVGFADSEDRTVCWQAWAEEHRQWRENYAIKAPLRSLYDQLFTLNQELQRNPDKLELLWGHGLTVWIKDARLVRLPVINTPVKLVFKPRQERFVVTRSQHETSTIDVGAFTSLVSTEICDLQRVANGFSPAVMPWDSEAVLPYLREFINSVSSCSECHYDRARQQRDITPADSPRLYDCPVLYTRPRIDNLWAKEFETAVRLFEEGAPIPPAFAALASRNHEPVEASDSQNWQQTGERILFPLPSNDEQTDIVHSLAKFPGVAVQGPPGTGKSHTIVNLIAHYIALGKRVLVTSEKAPALKVIGEKIRRDLPELSAFCVTVSHDSDGPNSLENAVRALQQGATFNKPAELKQEIARLYKRLSTIDSEVNQVRNAIAQYRIGETAQTRVLGTSNTPAEVGSWLAEHVQHGWLLDEVETESPAISDGEWAQLQDDLSTLEPADFALAHERLPELQNIHAARDIATFKEQLAQQEKLVLAVAEQNGHWDLSGMSAEDLLALSELADSTVEAEQWQDNWLGRIHLECNIEHTEARLYREKSASHLESLAADIRNAELELDKHHVKLPDGHSPRELSTALEAIRAVADTGKGFSTLRKLSMRKELTLLKRCQIDGQTPDANCLAEVELLLLKLATDAKSQELERLWNNAMSKCAGPSLPDTVAPVSWVERNISEIRKVLAYRENCRRRLEKIVAQMPGLETAKVDDVAQMRELARAARTQRQLHLAESALGPYRKLLAKLDTFTDELEHSIWSELQGAARACDPDAWQEAIDRATYLDELAERASRSQSLLKRLSQHAPGLVRELEEGHSQGDLPMLGQSFADAWQYARVRTWFDATCDDKQLRQHYGALRTHIAARYRVIAELVEHQAWLKLLERITPHQRATLADLAKIVAGYTKRRNGKYDAARARDAQALLPDCRPAIPVWIMPISEVLRSTPSGEPSYDLLIVDESSQSDLRALSLLSRAHKVLIVGDDKQVTPQGVGKKLDLVYEKHERRFLQNIPNTGLDIWGPRASLYERAYSIFTKVGRTTMLREHFRCVPEIIQWCNRFYNHQIRPIRVPTSSERLGEPFVVRYVPDAAWQEHAGLKTNEQEARAIVKQICHLCRDERYTGKTIGVVALQGGMDQPLLIQRLLLDALPPEEFAEHSVLCGDAKSFQGDERDVIFLSMVVAPNKAYSALTRRDDDRRFNVAVSRARDQIWLYHSVTSQELSSNSNDLRYQLLAYAEQAHKNLFDLDEAERRLEHYEASPFHREIYRTIVGKGYRATPEFEVGGRRIDIVIEGRTGRLAVECDGERHHSSPDQVAADTDRQLDLQRAGFVFERIGYPAYNRDPDAALQPVWDKLEELGIGLNGTDLLAPGEEEAAPIETEAAVQDVPQVAVEQSSQAKPAIAPDNERLAPHIRRFKQQELVLPLDDELPFAPNCSEPTAASKSAKPQATSPVRRPAKRKTATTKSSSDERPESKIKRAQIRQHILAILAETAKGSYIKDKFAPEILRPEGIRIGGQHLKRFRMRVSRNIRHLKETGKVTEKKAKTNIRIYLVKEGE